MSEYEPKAEYAAQGDTRTVKFLAFTYRKIADHPVFPGQQIIAVRVADRGAILSLDDMLPADLEKGERLGAFYTTEELNKLEGGEQEAAALEEASISEMGEVELAEYIKDNELNVDKTVALAGDDLDLAKRVLDAENILTSNDPRKGVLKGLTAIIQRSSQ